MHNVNMKVGMVYVFDNHVAHEAQKQGGPYASIRLWTWLVADGFGTSSKEADFSAVCAGRQQCLTSTSQRRKNYA